MNSIIAKALFESVDYEQYRKRISDFLSEGKSTGLFHAGDKDAVKGTGYGSKEKALATIKIIDELNKKDHRHAMAIATTMMNRAKHSENQTEGMREAIPIFKEWIDKNRTT